MSINNQSTQAERLAQLRRKKGFTAEQLAQAMTAAGAKVSRGAISNWERGTNGIVSSKLPTLARILDCSEGYLLRGDLQGTATQGDATDESSPPQSSNSNEKELSTSTIIGTQPNNNAANTQSNTPSYTNNAASGHAMNTIKETVHVS